MLRQFVVVFAAVLAAALAMFAFIKPKDFADQLRFWQRMGAPSQGERCLEAIREVFPDPSSLELISERFVRHDDVGDHDIVRIEYRARNAFGRYLTESWDCPYPTYKDGRPMDWRTAKGLIYGDFILEPERRESLRRGDD